MRLFLAVDFHEPVKEKIAALQSQIKQHCPRGNFSEQNNFHLTLVFIGETNRVSPITAAMDEITAEPFLITIKNTGVFKKTGGSICWLGIKISPILWDMQRKLAQSLTKSGFIIEGRAFKPHLTLARQVLFEENFDFTRLSKQLEPITDKIEHISLMKSQRIGEKLVYNEIYRKLLGS